MGKWDNDNELHRKWEKKFRWLVCGNDCGFCKFCNCKFTSLRNSNFEKHERTSKHCKRAKGSLKSTDPKTDVFEIPIQLDYGEGNENSNQHELKYEGGLENPITVMNHFEEEYKNENNFALPGSHLTMEKISEQLENISDKIGGVMEQIDADNDKFILFGKHISNELKEIKDPIILKNVMHKINTVIYEGQTEMFRGNDIPLME